MNIIKKSLFAIFLLAAHAANAEWITLAPSNIENIQVVEPTISSGVQEGIYVVFKTNFTTTACTGRKAIAILDAKLADRAYSTLLFAIATQKTIIFYLNEPGKCSTQGVPVATAFQLVP